MRLLQRYLAYCAVRRRYQHFRWAKRGRVVISVTRFQ